MAQIIVRDLHHVDKTGTNRSTDLEAIAQIALELFPNNFNGQKKDPLSQARIWVGEQDGYGHYLVAESGSRVVGYAHSQVIAHAAGVVAITEFGKKVGEEIKDVCAALIDGTETWWRVNQVIKYRKPLTALLVHTRDSGVDICERLGFSVAAKLPGLYGPSPQGDEYIMRKDFG